MHHFHPAGADANEADMMSDHMSPVATMRRSSMA